MTLSQMPIPCMTPGDECKNYPRLSNPRIPQSRDGCGVHNSPDTAQQARLVRSAPFVPDPSVGRPTLLFPLLRDPPRRLTLGAAQDAAHVEEVVRGFGADGRSRGAHETTGTAVTSVTTFPHLLPKLLPKSHGLRPPRRKFSGQRSRTGRHGAGRTSTQPTSIPALTSTNEHGAARANTATTRC
jgi:hypothetical protein